MLEGFYTIEMSREVVKAYLVGLAHHLHLRTYSDPMIYSPASGMGRDENAGFDGLESQRRQSRRDRRPRSAGGRAISGQAGERRSLGRYWLWRPVAIPWHQPPPGLEPYLRSLPDLAL
jgi:hypothetical protein